MVGFASVSVYGNHRQHLRALGEQEPLSEADGDRGVSPNPTLPRHGQEASSHPGKKLGFGGLQKVTLL